MLLLFSNNVIILNFILRNGGIMEQKVCCFIGHRNITVTKKLEETVYGVVEQLIVCCGVGVFLFGSKSQFDDLCRYVVSSLKEKYPYLKRVAYTARSEGCVLECERDVFLIWFAIFYERLKKIVKIFNNVIKSAKND